MEQHMQHGEHLEPHFVVDAPPASIGAGSALKHLDRWSRIAVAAYHLAEARGFEPGRELDDWLVAEAAVNRESKHAEGAVV
jgi:hypothetical protein